MYQDPEYTYVRKTDDYRLICTEWRAVTEISKEDPLFIHINYKVYVLKDKDIRFDDFYNETKRDSYKTVMLPADIVGVALQCKKCAGCGTTDWVGKVMNRSNKYPPVRRYHRDPHSRTLSFKIPLANSPYIESKNSTLPRVVWGCESLKNYLERGIIEQTTYTSMPHLKTYEEYCPVCFGIGLHFISSKDAKFTGTYQPKS